MLECVKESGYVSKCNPTGEFSFKSIKMIFSPVHQSSPVVVDYPHVSTMKLSNQNSCPKFKVHITTYFRVVLKYLGTPSKISGPP